MSIGGQWQRREAILGLFLNQLGPAGSGAYDEIQGHRVN